MSGNILVVDDEESIRFTLSRFLQNKGYDSRPAAGLEEALDRVEKEKIDVIFADILLGDHSGLELLRYIQERSLPCPVIMLTGYPSLDTASEAVRLGAYDYIPKPIKQETLLRVTKMALEHKNLREEKERYRANMEAIFRSVKDAIITVDTDFRLQSLNEAARRLCHLKDSQLGLQPEHITNDCQKHCLVALRTSLSTKSDCEIKRLVCNSGQRQVVTVKASPLLDNKKEVAGAVMVIRDETRLNDLERDLAERKQLGNIVGQSHSMQKVYEMIEQLAQVPTTVLITGESGTGKELVAEALHYQGDRADEPLVKVNCAGLSENLLESELFGHVRGAFTGAIKDRKGRFECANKGTIFLDEIGDISPRMQLRLLRTLQDKMVERVGDSHPIKVDVRIIAATNQNLRQKIQSGEFREDLFYRLKVVNIALPSLRDRKEDIPLFVAHFLKRFNDKFKKNIANVSRDVNKIFMSYHWPGNIRELEHVLERAVILCRGNTIEIDDLPPELLEQEAPTFIVPPSPEEEAQVLLAALKTARGNKSKAAELLGISRRTLYRRLDSYVDLGKNSG